MIGRLGNVIYWGCSAISVTLAVVLLGHYAMGGAWQENGGSKTVGLVISATIFMFGRAAKYVLSGK